MLAVCNRPGLTMSGRDGAAVRAYTLQHYVRQWSHSVAGVSGSEGETMTKIPRGKSVLGDHRRDWGRV